MNYYPHHIGDYASATMHLSISEDGAYRRLLDLYYLHERPLPGDKRQVYRLARVNTRADQQAVDAVLAEFFSLEEGVYRHKRCDVEIARAQSKSNKARASAAQRWQSEGNANGDANASSNAMRTHSEGICEGNAPNNQEPITKRKTAGRKRPLPDDFGISDRVRSWADENGYGNLERRLEHFVGYAKAKGATYADWDQALMNAIRGDWAKLNGTGKHEPADDFLAGYR